MTTNAPLTHRLTLGLLTPDLSMQTDRLLWQALVDLSHAQDFNALCYVGGHLRNPGLFETQRNVMYDLANVERLDGLIIFGGSVGAYLSVEEMTEFCVRYHPLPLVSVSLVLPGIPSIGIDNYRGVYETMEHLINVHGCQRIACVRGRPGHVEADIRYQAYVGALQAHNLPVDPALVVAGDFLPESGAEAVRVLLEERGVTFDALVAANDHVAIRAMEALQARGILVPHEVAVAGFDDWLEASVVTPPLTTVRQPWYAIGRQAVEMVLAQIRGQEVRSDVLASPEFVVRQSCGCVMPEVARVSSGLLSQIKLPAGVPAEVFTACCHEQRAALLAALHAPLARYGAVPGLPEAWAEPLLAAFIVDVRDAESGAFLAQLDAVLQIVLVSGGDVLGWHDVISAMRRAMLPCLPDMTLLVRAEDLWQQARVLLGGVARRIEAYRQIREGELYRTLQAVEQNLIASFELTDLMNVTHRELPQLGIERCYLSLYVDPAVPVEGARLVLAYDETGRQAVEPQRAEFVSPQLFPEGLVTEAAPYAFAVTPLFFRELQLGFAVFQGGPAAQVRYDTLQRQLSSSLKGAVLVEQVEQRARQLQAASAVAEAASSILDPDALIQEVVNLVQQRFDLYYAGLFLVDEVGTWTGEPGKWAVLRAGTGAPGREMLTQGHKLEIGGASMIGACLAYKEARIALDVGEEAVRFDNPHLPETHSEMALPLIGRGQAIGALTIQSSRMNAFSQEDITVLQTMASQLATAIENVRLLAETQRRTQELLVLNDLSQRLAAHLDVDGIVQEVYHGASLLLPAPYLHVALYAAEKQTFTLPLYAENGRVHSGAAQIYSADSGLVGHIIRNRLPVLIREDIPGWLARHNIELTAVGAGKMPQSWLGVPILLGDRVLGAIVVQSVTQARLYNEHDRDLLTSIAGHAAIALENARLLQRTQETLRETQLLYRASRALIASENPREALRDVVEQVVQAISAHRVMLLVLDTEAQTVEDFLVAGPGKAEAQPLTYTELQQGLTGWVLRQKEVALSPKGQRDSRESAPVRRRRAAEGVGAVVVTPLLYRGQVLGTLTAINQMEQPDFTEQDVELMTALANQAAAALANARLLEQTRLTLRETEALYRASQALVAFADVRAATQAVSDIAREALEAQQVLLLTFDMEQQELLDVVYSGLAEATDDDVVFTFAELLEGLSGWAIRERRAALSPKGTPDPRESPAVQERRARTQTGAIIVAPLVYQDQVLGTLTAVNLQTRPDFTSHDADLLMALAQQAAAALANARLLEQTQATVRSMEALQRRYQEQSWRHYLDAARLPGYELAASGVEPLGDAVLPEVWRVETEMRPLIFTEEEVAGAERSALLAPSMARGQVLGTIGIHDDDLRHWSPDEIAILEAVAERMAMTAENLRLLDETQRRAAQERLTGEIAARMRESLDVEKVLQTTVQELGRAVGAGEVSIRLLLREDE